MVLRVTVWSTDNHQSICHQSGLLNPQCAQLQAPGPPSWKFHLGRSGTEVRSLHLDKTPRRLQWQRSSDPAEEYQRRWDTSPPCLRKSLKAWKQDGTSASRRTTRGVWAPGARVRTRGGWSGSTPSCAPEASAAESPPCNFPQTGC